MAPRLPKHLQKAHNDLFEDTDLFTQCEIDANVKASERRVEYASRRISQIRNTIERLEIELSQKRAELSEMEKQIRSGVFFKTNDYCTWAGVEIFNGN